MSHSTLQPKLANRTKAARSFAIGSLLALTWLAAGCRTAPLVQAAPVALSGDPARVERAIAIGARRAGWVTDEPAPGSAAVDARFVVKPGQYAVVRIDYGGPQLSFRYAGSSNLSCEPDLAGESCARIHKNYNKWLLGLRAHIAQALVEPSLPPIDESQALSIIRQMVEEQPNRSAYTTVDVDDQRVAAVRHERHAVYYPDLFLDPYPHFYGPYYGHRRGYWFHRSPFFYDYTVSIHEFQRTDVVYYNNIGRIQLDASGRWQVVRIWDRYGQRKMKLLSLDEFFAKRFIDALEVMEDARRADAEEPDVEPSSSS